MLEAIGFGIIVLIWVVSSLIKGFKWLLRQTGATPTPPALTALPPSQAVPRGQIPPTFPPPATLQSQTKLQAPPPSQTLPARAPRLDSPRPRERQPQAGGPAVPDEATRRDFERQERELFRAEPAALDTPLASFSLSPSASANSLFGGTDDLVRAIILQEVLGPPLSHRKPQPAAPPTQTAPQ